VSWLPGVSAVNAAWMPGGREKKSCHGDKPIVLELLRYSDEVRIGLYFMYTKKYTDSSR